MIQLIIFTFWRVKTLEPCARVDSSCPIQWAADTGPTLATSWVNGTLWVSLDPLGNCPHWLHISQRYLGPQWADHSCQCCIYFSWSFNNNIQHVFILQLSPFHWCTQAQTRYSTTKVRRYSLSGCHDNRPVFPNNTRLIIKHMSAWWANAMPAWLQENCATESFLDLLKLLLYWSAVEWGAEISQQ